MTDDRKDMASANGTFNAYVNEIIDKDKRFVGMSKYVSDIAFFWSYSISTACAGHGYIFFNPKWWDKLHHEERKTVIAHEIWHLILNHLERGKGKDPSDYNKAGDYVINLTCHEDGFLTTKTIGGAPTNFGDIGMLIDFRFDNMGTDKVYEIIRKERKNDPNLHGGSSDNDPSADQIEDLIKELLESSNMDIQQVAEENAKKRDKAIEDAKKSIGNQPRGTKQLIQTEGRKVFIQSETYEEIFKDYLTDPLSGGKRTYMRPSRRQSKTGPKLKGKYPKRGRKNRLTHLVYALDVSGSISDDQKKQFLRSAKTLKEKLNPVMMTVILWDTQIQFEKVFLEDEELDNINVMTGGSTSLGPVYKRVTEINPEALVIFTDLAVSIPPKPTWETIWFVPFENIHPTYLDKVPYGNVYLIPEEK